MNNWYVYRHIRLDKNEPFYIGIGNKKNYLRAYDVEKRNEIWKKIYKKTNIEVDILFDNITKDEASVKEQEFIKLYGRKDLNTGLLCNMTDGGDGIWNCKRTSFTKEKLRQQKLGSKNPQYGKKQSEEIKIKRGIYKKGRKASEESIRNRILGAIKSGQAKKTLVITYVSGEEIGIFNSLNDALRHLGIDIKYNSKASLVANGKRKQTKGYIFKFL